MAVCGKCSQEMNDDGTVTCVVRPGLVRFGLEHPELEHAERCHDCGVAAGGFHHPGCCVAWCQACVAERLFCGCDPFPQ
jgi:hypothetical protein